MRFTVKALHKRLGKLIDEGHGRKIVCIDKSSFQHNLETDGCVILEVSGLGVKWVPTMDGDGGTAYRSDGYEAGRTMLVLAGDAGANMKGELVERRQ